MRYLMYFVHTMLTVRDVHHAEGTLPLNLSESQRSIEKSLTLHHSNMHALLFQEIPPMYVHCTCIQVLDG